MTSPRTVLTLLVLACATTGCGYFNSLYNARRQFADAERARSRGETINARGGYVGSIEKAAKSYRKYPNGRWADDALYLIARGRFQLGEYLPARAAFRELLGKTKDPAVRAGAHAFAGATEVRLAEPHTGLAHLDSAVAAIDSNSGINGFVRLWRARARAATGDVGGAWQDLDTAVSPNDTEYDAVQLERISFAIAAGDTVRAQNGFAGLLASRNARRSLVLINDLANAAVTRFGADAVRAMLATSGGDWIAIPRDSLALISAQIAARAGDTIAAHRELMQLAGRSAPPVAAAARLSVARARLGSIDKLEQLSEIRALVLPAIPDAEAFQMVSTIRLIDVLVRRSLETGQPLALFAAAELARDELKAPRIARQLFITFSDVGAQTPWAGKALLAAIALDAAAPESNELRSRLSTLPPNPYTAATRGEEAQEAYEVAEDRLARLMITLRSEALQLAQQQETGLVRAVFVLDSIRIAAQADTVRAACGVMIDTLAVTGIRADSVRSACVRGDTAAVNAHLKADTLAWLRSVNN